MSPDASLHTIETLRAASALIMQGDHSRARAALTDLVRTDPGCADAHRLLGDSLYQTGEFVRARKELRACLRLRPDALEAAVLLGRVLAASGQPQEALRVLQGAAQQDPSDLGAACALARVWLAQGRADAALQVLEPVTAHGVAVNAEFLMLTGYAWIALGKPEVAAEAFARWVQLEPQSADARMRLAAALADARRSVEAEAEIRRCMAAGHNTPDTAFVLARALMGQGRFEEAESHLRAVVHARPDHRTAQDNLAELVWMRTGDVHAACAELDAALRQHPRLHALRMGKARLLLSARRAPDALAELELGLALDPGDAALLKDAAVIALDFDGDRALDYAVRARQAAPADRVALVAFGNASLAVGDAAHALEAAAALHQSRPTDGQALAMLADAWRMLGDERYRELLDYTHFVRAETLDVPPGWDSLAAYVAEVQAALERAHTFRAHPIGNSLRLGSQVELTPERSNEPAIRAFPAAIDGPIRRYMAALGHGDDPMRSRNGNRYAISGMWSVRLHANGFHVNHYHPEGWMSSACYLHLPPAVEHRGGEGWLKFGEPAFPTRPRLEPEYLLKPAPGLLALFPSYMWHGTVPFSGTAAESRLTIAFDVAPAP